MDPAAEMHLKGFRRFVKLIGSKGDKEISVGWAEISQALKAELKGVIQSCMLNQLKIIIKTKRKKNKDAKSLAVNVSCLF